MSVGQATDGARSSWYRDERWGAVAVKDRDDPTTTHSTRSPTFATHSTLSPPNLILRISSEWEEATPWGSCYEKTGTDWPKIGAWTFAAYGVDFVFLFVPARLFATISNTAWSDWTVMARSPITRLPSGTSYSQGD
jgi:hypothetical protein